MAKSTTSRTIRAPRVPHPRGLVRATALLALLAAVPGGSQELAAVRAAAPPRIDGVLEDAWNGAPRIARFTQIEPAMGAPATAETEVFVLYDAKHLYLAARVYQPAATVRAASAKRDSASIWDGDFVLFAVDSHASGNTAHFLLINPANAVIDGVLDASATWNRDWDAAVVTATSRDATSWTAEAAIPLEAIGFQARSVQQWGFLAARRFAERQEETVSSIADRNAVFRVDAFPRLGGIELERPRSALAVVPYVFSALSSGGGREGNETKSGFDLRFSPMPSMKLLATFQPDFAQLESDREIINVSDVPTSYPEKRPFFTESSDFYPGLAVNTRNIGDIRAGVKLRQVLPKLRYDLTAVEDESRARWFLGDFRWTDNRRYHLELIGGLKETGVRSDHNVTTNLRTWFLDKRLTAYTWFGTINGRDGAPRQWESVNSIRWATRSFRAGVWSHAKSELYNPNIVGHNTLSNEIVMAGWIGWSRFSDRGRLLELSPEIKIERFDLYTSRGSDHVRLKGRLAGRIRASQRLGVWTAELEASPKARRTFRHRDVDGEAGFVHRDAFGQFVLVDENGGESKIALKSDPSKLLSAELSWLSAPLRGAESQQIDAEGIWKIGARSTLSFALGRIEVGASSWQRPFVQTVQRLRVEHTFANRLNVRGIYQTNVRESDAPTTVPTLNLLLSWPLSERTALHFLASETRAPVAYLPGDPEHSNRSVAFKVSHAFSFR